MNDLANTKIKILVIEGPTATGKSDLAVQLAHWVHENMIGGFTNAEIISADSRQLYKGLNIGTGKITREEMIGVIHHGLDIADPDTRYSVSQWKNYAERVIGDIYRRGNLPIICGGTGFYISSLINETEFPNVQLDADELLRLEKMTVEELHNELHVLDPQRAKSMETGGDNKNKRRLVRAIQIARSLGSVPKVHDRACQPTGKYDAFIVGVSLPDAVLKERINSRLIKRIEIGMIDEAITLHKPKPGGFDLSYSRMEELGLEYKYLSKLLQNSLSLDEFTGVLKTKIWQYARRQKTWFKKEIGTKWFDPSDIDGIKKVAKNWATSKS